ncbi:hypothetical protein [Thiothrix sp.]|uniref:hypothetical protein n=1 Tax=Thiothrix sp. TaxID=1032 RepID=UPI00257F8146|nr:hypothetical protein [Thiothrix sp.]
MPGSGKASPESWSGEAKFAVVLETTGMNASEVGEYCRSKGLYSEQVARWKQACIAGAGTGEQTGNESLKHARKQIRQLEKDLRRKEKALAESAALLILQKKFNALWERGMMTTPQQRETVVRLVDEAISAGARRSPACQVVGINVRTLQRWHPQVEQQVRVGQRPLAKRPSPPVLPDAQPRKAGTSRVCRMKGLKRAKLEHPNNGMILYIRICSDTINP